jgi:hypothetical protein
MQSTTRWCLNEGSMGTAPSCLGQWENQDWLFFRFSGTLARRDDSHLHVRKCTIFEVRFVI